MAGDTLTTTATTTAFAGVALLMLVAPFELTSPLLRLPRQSVSNLEAALLIVSGLIGSQSIAWSRRWPEWKTPLTVRGSCWWPRCFWPPRRRRPRASTRCTWPRADDRLWRVPPHRQRRHHARAAASAVTVAVIAGVAVAVIAILEYFRVAPVLQFLRAFRPSLTVVSAQVRAPAARCNIRRSPR